MVVKGQEDVLAQAKPIVDKAEQTQIKAKRKALLTAVATTRRGMVRVCPAQKKLKELLKRLGSRQRHGQKDSPYLVDNFGCMQEASVIEMGRAIYTVIHTIYTVFTLYFPTLYPIQNTGYLHCSTRPIPY